MIRLIFSLLVNLVTLLLWPLVVLGRHRAAPKGAWLEVEIDGAIAELVQRQPFWMRQKPVFALNALREAIALAAQDARIAGLLVTLKSVRAGSATASALRGLLLEARRAGKRVAVYMPDGAGTRETYVASAADLVVVGPETFVAPLGFAVQSAYVRRALDRAGVEAEVFARGRYKAAGESLVLDRMSDPQREQLGALLDVTWDVLITALSEGRKVPRERAEQWVERGPWSARTALEQGIIDEIAYADELGKELVSPGARVESDEEGEGPPRVSVKKYLRARRRGLRPLVRKPKVAVIEIKGPIVSEHVGVAPVAAEDEVCRAVDRAREAARYRAAVLYIDSPGGSALASDRMLHAIRRLAAKKPVIACMGDAAASGGYMVALGAHAIFAQPTTITGSIGVVSARVVLQPLLDRLGIVVDVVKRGRRADMMSMAHGLDPEDRAAVEGQLDDIYQSFLQAVALGRRRDVSEIEELAGGRVWSGRDALAHGLIDQLGGFGEALAEARRRLGPAFAKLEPELISALHWRPRGGLIPRLLQLLPRTASPLDALGWLWAAASLRQERAYLLCELSELDLGR